MTTPNALLAEVGAAMVPALALGDTVQTGILKKALREYDARMGHFESVEFSIEEGQTGFPVAFGEADLMYAVDRDQGFVTAWISGGSLLVDDVSLATDPLKAYYIVRLSELDLETDDLPKNVLTLFARYLEVLLKEANIPQIRTAYETSGVSTENLPTVQDVSAERENIEEELKEAKPYLPIGMVMS